MTDANHPHGGRIKGWSRVVTARPRLSLLLALLFVALAAVAGSGVGDRLKSGGWNDPNAESSYSSEALEREFPASQPNLVLLVDSGAATVDDPRVMAEAHRLAARLDAEPSVTGITSYWSTGSPALRAEDRKEAMITARISGDETAAAKVLDRLEPQLRGEHGPVEVSLGGQAAVQHELQSTIEEDLLRAELIALPITLVLLIMIFGSAIAALLPLGIGIVAILGTNAVLRALTEFTDVSVFALNLTTALGLGLAIDYALFIVRRFREELSTGAEPLAAVAATLRTAGRTVLFSSLTVAVSLAAMMVFPQFFLRSFAYAGIAVVLIAATAALTLLPAALLLLGHRVNALDLRRLWRRRREVPGSSPSGPEAARPGPRADSAPEAGAGWARLGRLVMRRAPLFATATTVGLMLLGLPFLGVQFGSADHRQLPSQAESHLVHERIDQEFPGTPGAAVEVLLEGRPTEPELAEYSSRLSTLPGALRVTSPTGTYAEGARVVDPGPAEAVRSGEASVHISVLSTDEAVDVTSQRLVQEIRAEESPSEVSVAGQAATLVDTKDTIAERLPWALVIIVLVTLLLVFLLTGSVWIPVQAVLLNALSLTAMFGAVVWVFQDGNLSGVLRFTATGSIETTLPVLMFCIAFGLSMDYGVFLLSRIKEEYDRTGDHQHSVVFGLQRTGGLITAAALILAVIMMAIGTSRVANTKMLGLGIALAVLMDAMVVRSLLVPAVMRLTGRATWWAPGPLRKLHGRIGLSEGEPGGSGGPGGPGGGDGKVPSSAPEHQELDPVGSGPR